MQMSTKGLGLTESLDDRTVDCSNTDAEKLKIAVLPGDGIGPEIVVKAVRVLNALDENFEMETAAVVGAGYEAEGVPLPENTLKQ